MNDSYNVYQIYKDLEEIKDTIPSINSFGAEALKLAEQLTGHLELLETLTSYNFRHQSQYKSLLNYDSATDFDTWKMSALKYCDEGLTSVIYYLVHNDDPKGFKYFLQHYRNIFDQAAGLKRFLDTASEKTKDITVKSSEIEALVSKAESDQKRITSLADTFTTTETKLATLDETISDLSNKSALLEGIKNFEEIALYYQKAAKWWLIGGVIAGGALVILIFLKLFDYSMFTHIAANIAEMFYSNFSENVVSTTLYVAYGKYILVNLLVVTLLLFIVSTCVKNYRANMHNHVVCRHKASSLDSAKKLINNTTSPEIHQFILASAANAIFSHQNTGYNDKEEGSDGANLAILSKLMDSVKPNIVKSAESK